MRSVPNWSRSRCACPSSGHRGTRGDTNQDVARFHRILLCGCRNPMLEELIGGLYGRSHALRYISAATPGRVAVLRQESADPIDAIRRRSAADAAEVARRHVTAARASAKVAMSVLIPEADRGADGPLRRATRGPGNSASRRSHEN
ncbi:FCD domain-containing protein [Streptomyces melanosporofaciens]|uniref:FCD domain-containing protein n=1 Tax=Streptomyces melanosporofaciens TaxID=67327 RepID=UPI000B849535